MQESLQVEGLATSCPRDQSGRQESQVEVPLIHLGCPDDLQTLPQLSTSATLLRGVALGIPSTPV